MVLQGSCLLFRHFCGFPGQVVGCCISEFPLGLNTHGDVQPRPGGLNSSSPYQFLNQSDLGCKLPPRREGLSLNEVGRVYIWGFRARAKAARLLRWLCQLSSGQHSDKSENEPTL